MEKNNKNNKNNKTFNDIINETKKYIDQKYIIIKLKKYFDTKIKQINENTTFNNKVIIDNKINFKDYIFKEEGNFFNYFSNDYYNYNIFLNFNLIKFIKDIFEKEISYNNTSNTVNVETININNYFILYNLIIKLINIKNLNKFNFLSLFFTDYDINNLIKLMFENQIFKSSEKYKTKYIDEIYKIYLELHFKIDEKNFLYLSNTVQEILKYNQNNNNKYAKIKQDNFKILKYRELLYIFYYNQNKLDKNCINFIKEDVLKIFNYQNNNNKYIIYKKDGDKINTKYKYNLYLIYSILFLLNLFNDKENKNIKKIISSKINIIINDYNEYFKYVNDEKILKDFFNEQNIEHITQFYDHHHIMQYDFFIPEKNLIIELDGLYHYKSVVQKDGVIINKYNIKDLVKTELAKTLGYNILRISSVYNVENLNNLYIDRFGKLNDISIKNTNIYLEDIFDDNNNIQDINLIFPFDTKIPFINITTSKKINRDFSLNDFLTKIINKN